MSQHKTKSLNKVKSHILKLILVRHAESEENVRFEALRLRFQKGIKTMPLPEALKVFKSSMRNCSITTLGEQMANEVNKKLVNVKLPQIDQYWHSPLKRTLQTMSRLFPNHAHKFQEKLFLREKRVREFIFSRGFRKRIERFRNELCNLDHSVTCIVATGHGMFFRSFLGENKMREMKNVEVVMCDFDRNTGTVLNAKTMTEPSTNTTIVCSMFD